MSRFELPWEKEPISGLIRAFDCTVQHVETIEEGNDGHQTVEDTE